MVCITSWICCEGIDQPLDLFFHVNVSNQALMIWTWTVFEDYCPQTCQSGKVWRIHKMNSSVSALQSGQASTKMMTEPKQIDSKLNSQLPDLCRVGAGPKFKWGFVDPHCDNGAFTEGHVQSSPSGHKWISGEKLWRKRESWLKSSGSRMLSRPSFYVEKISKNGQHEYLFSKSFAESEI